MVLIVEYIFYLANFIVIIKHKGKQQYKACVSNNDLNLYNLESSIFKILILDNIVKIIKYFLEYRLRKYTMNYFFNITFKNLTMYLLCFLMGFFTQTKSKLLKEKIDSSLDLLVLCIYKDIKNINCFIYLIFGSFFLLIAYVYNSFLFYFLYKICFSVISLIEWIKLNQHFISKHKLGLEIKNIIFYNIIRYLLLSLLLVNLFILARNILNFIFYIINPILNSFNNILNIKEFSSKWKNFNLKESLDLKKKLNKSPKNPKDWNWNIFNPNKKKEHKDITKKALEMKEKLMETQNRKLTGLDLNFELASQNKQSFGSYSHNKWKETITIEERPQISIDQQMDRIKSELKAYNDQSKKFKNIINNINKGKEKFYPEESKHLFKDYVELVDTLRVNIKYMETNLKKHVSKRNNILVYK